MTVRIYHSTDEGAPVLEGEAGSMIHVLETVLVHGYGDKQPLGWTKELHTSNVAAFRNDPTIPGSTGMYLRVNDSNRETAYCRVYKTMSDIDTGTDVAPNVLITLHNDYVYWWKHQSGNRGPKRWSLIGDERTFYMLVQAYGAYLEYDTGYWGIYGCGDYVSFVPGNEWNYFVIGGGQSNATSSYRFPNWGANNFHTFFMGRAQDLIPNKSSRGNPICLYNNNPGSTSFRNVSPYTGIQHFCPSYFDSYDADATYIGGTLRGVVWRVGAAVQDWFTSVGKIEGPNGPNFYELASNQSSSWSLNGSIVVKDRDWE